MANLRATLNAAREACIAAEWQCDVIGRHDSGLFCNKDGVRMLVGINRVEPRSRH